MGTNATTATESTVASDSHHKKQRGHVLPRPPVIDVHKPGRLRTCHVLALGGFCHSALYERMNIGRFPKPDGNDGRNFWNTSTVCSYLEGVEK